MMGAVTGVVVAWATVAGVSPVLAQGPSQPAVLSPASQAALQAVTQASSEAQGQNRLLLVTYSFDAQKAKQNTERLARPITAAWIKRYGAVHAVTDQALIRSWMNQDIKQMPGQDPVVFEQGKPGPVRGTKLAQSVRPQSPAGDLILAWRLDQMTRPSQEPVNAFEKTAEQRPQALDVNPFLEEVLAARKLAVEGKSAEALQAYAAILSKGILDQELRTVSVSRIAQEMASVTPGKLSKGVFETERQKAVASVIAAVAPMLDVRDARDLHAMLVVLRISEQADEALAFIDTAMNQPVIFPLSVQDRELLEILLRHAHWNDPTKVSTDPTSFPLRLHAQAVALSQGGEADDSRRFVTYTQWLAEHEAVRRYAYLATSLSREQRVMAEKLGAEVAKWPNGAQLKDRMRVALLVQGPRPKN
jgi:hypothetical protein